MAKKKATSKVKPAGPSSDLDFEQSLEQVEQIVVRLEGGQLGLSESLQQYEAGIQQLKLCHQLLDAAEQRVNVLAGFDADGNPILETLERAPKGRKAVKKKKSDAAPDAGNDRGEGDGNDSESDSHQSLF